MRHTDLRIWGGLASPSPSYPVEHFTGLQEGVTNPGTRDIMSGNQVITRLLSIDAIVMRDDGHIVIHPTIPLRLETGYVTCLFLPGAIPCDMGQPAFDLHHHGRTRPACLPGSRSRSATSARLIGCASVAKT